MAIQTPNQPQRVCIRLPCDIPAEISFSGGDSKLIKKTTISNISTTGLQILCPSFVATGQTLSAQFKLPGQSSKTTLTAEVVRIESLQGRMIGHYPYALGAKFVTPEFKQENKIKQFISNKITCASLRLSVAWLFFIVGITQFGRALLHSGLISSDLLALDLRGFSSAMTGNWLLHPLLAGFVAANCFASMILCVLNKKSSKVLGLVCAGIQIIYSLTILIAKRNLLTGSPSDPMLWSAELLLLAAGLGLIALLIQLSKERIKMEKIITADRAPSAPNRPTFTIL